MLTLKRLLRWLGLLPKHNPLVIRYWQDTKWEWRFQFRRSGQIVGESGESYHNLTDCESTVRSTLDAIRSGNITVEHDVT